MQPGQQHSLFCLTAAHVYAANQPTTNHREPLDEAATLLEDSKVSKNGKRHRVSVMGNC